MVEERTLALRESAIAGSLLCFTLSLTKIRAHPGKVYNHDEEVQSQSRQIGVCSYSQD